MLVALLVGVLGFFGYTNMRATVEQVDVTTDVEFPALVKLNEMKSLVLEGIAGALAYTILDDPLEKAEFYETVD